MPWKKVLHTHLWQKLPRGFRRHALFHLTSRLAPKPTPHAPATSPFIVVGFLRTASGLGEGARLCHDALKQYGHQVYGVDLTTQFNQTGPIVPFSFQEGRAVEGSGTIILHINGPFVPMALLHLGKRLIAGKRLVGYWAWELPKVPPEWRFGVPLVHEIWVPSQFTADAIASGAGEIQVRVVPHPVASRAALTTQTRRPREGPFTALAVFNMASGFTRKNPLAVVEAFRQAFDNDPNCQLILKVVNAESYPEGRKALAAAIASLPNAHIDDGSSGGRSVDELYASADVVLSLHRAEGFGLVIAEAMLRGLPVLATNWSGNVDFLTAENGLPVSYSLVPASDPQGTYDEPSSVWAEADIDDAAAKLLMLRDDPARAVKIGARAATDSVEMFSARRYVERVRELLGIGIAGSAGS